MLYPLSYEGGVASTPPVRKAMPSGERSGQARDGGEFGAARPAPARSWIGSMTDVSGGSPGRIWPSRVEQRCARWGPPTDAARGQHGAVHAAVGETVTFGLPAAGPSGTFDNGPTAVSGPDGYARVAVVPNTVAGSFQATASVRGVDNPGVIHLNTTWTS